MKAGFINWAQPEKGGGIFSSALGFARALENHGVAMSIFGISMATGVGPCRFWKGLRYLDCPAVLNSSFGYSPQLRDNVMRADLDVLHVHGLWTFASLVGARKRKSGLCKEVVSVHGMLDNWAMRNSRWKKVIAGYAFERRHLQRADCLHALTEKEFTSIRELGFKNPVAIIRNGVDVATDVSIQKKPAWLSHREEGKKILLFLGRLHPKKGIVNLLIALRKATDLQRSLCEDWVLVIAGVDEHDHQRALEVLVQNLRLSEAVRFVGPQFSADKTSCYAVADAFVLPSISEGLPMSLLEALGSAVPIIMTPHCNVPEAVDVGAAVEVSPAADGICRGLLRMFAMSSDQRKSMGLAGRRLVRQSFCWENAALRMSQTYGWLTGNGQRPACVVLD